MISNRAAQLHIMREANLQRHPVDGPEDSASLSDWLLSFGKSQGYAYLVSRFQQREGYITPPEETAMLYAIVQRLRPQWSLEIGTFFAHTTRIMAEVIVDAGIDGKIITLDPFGQERVPDILRSWPEPLSAVTDFRSWNSMQYFLELETQGTAKGADSPLGVVFVDGHHNFEYTLYDTIRSADHLAPGGAIITDNLEQQGPKTAAIQFLRWNPAWSLFYEGHLFSADNIDQSTIGVNPDGRTLWGGVGRTGWNPNRPASNQAHETQHILCSYPGACLQPAPCQSPRHLASHDGVLCGPF